MYNFLCKIFKQKFGCSKLGYDDQKEFENGIWETVFTIGEQDKDELIESSEQWLNTLLKIEEDIVKRNKNQ